MNYLNTFFLPLLNGSLAEKSVFNVVGVVADAWMLKAKKIECLVADELMSSECHDGTSVEPMNTSDVVGTIRTTSKYNCRQHSCLHATPSQFPALEVH